jgi:SAM-dependent methyltransferase
VTNYISTDISAVPLLWIIPLAIYLITFILVFAPRPLLPHRVMLKAQPFFLLPLMILFFWGLKPLPLSFIPLHLLAFFVTAMVCHGELAKTRPSTIYLTEFYLWLSVGGILGGLFNALFAPMVFDTLAEYPLVIALACLLRPPPNPKGQKPNEIWLDLAFPMVLTIILGGLVLFISKPGLGQVMRLDDSGSWLGLMIIVFISCFIGFILYLSCERPIRFGLGVGGVILASFLWASGQNQVLYSERNFFGVLEVVHDAADGYNLLHHGTTIHGAQSLNPSRRGEPLTYYHPTGPAGQVFEVFSNKPNKNRVAIIGLGTGSLACYAVPRQEWTFYEIDPAVARIARDPRYFTFLRDCPAKMDVVLGDGRLSLAQAPDGHFDLIVLDVFSSDAIPVHFLTREAINVYLKKLSDGGILLFHISNKYLNLKPVLGDLAANASLACLVQENRISSLAEEKAKKIGSIWVVMARQTNDLGSLFEDRRWEPLPGRRGARLWSDDFSNVLSVFKWSPSKD